VSRTPVLLSLGFRVFFLLGVAHAIAAMGLWLAALQGVSLPFAGLAPTAWHGHEMVFGFSLAIVAGFLLTAVRNWTGLPTVSGWPLGALALCWLLPRVLLSFGGASVLPVAAALDVGFGIGLLVAIGRPIWEKRQARQIGIMSKLSFLVLGELLFYAGAAGWLEDGVRWGLYTGVYMIVALVLTIARRVVAFFVRSVAPDNPRPAENKWLDRVSLFGFFGLYIVDVFTPWRVVLSALALVLVLVHSVRLWTWWSPVVARVPLLWVLFLAYAWIIVGFGIHAASPWLGWPENAALHAYTAGGIGSMTLGMVARVSLGHTGRDVRAVHPFLAVVFGIGAWAAVARVAVPIGMPAWSSVGYSLGASLWLAAFSMLFGWGLPMWIGPRVDGKP